MDITKQESRLRKPLPSSARSKPEGPADGRFVTTGLGVAGRGLVAHTGWAGGRLRDHRGGATVNTFLADARGTLFPEPGSKHGPLPPLLLALTLLTGLVDAFSYLVLGHVFVANMTGNVVFLGFALAGAPGFSIAASVVALGSFWSGAFIGGGVGSRFGQTAVGCSTSPRRSRACSWRLRSCWPQRPGTRWWRDSATR